MPDDDSRQRVRFAIPPRKKMIHNTSSNGRQQQNYDTPSE